MTIKNWQYLDDYLAQRDMLLQVIDRVLSSGRLILGPEVEAFERNFSDFCKVFFGVGVNSGTDALFISLKALGVKEGDEVVTIPFTAVPTVAAIRAAGATPVFVDVEEDTFLMDVSKVEAAITSKTRCVIPVHLFGQAVDMGPLMEIATSRNLHIVEDCAQAAGATYHGKRVGGFGVIGAFSFYPTKILGAYGDAGMAVTDSSDLYRALKRLRFYGMEKAYCAEAEGFNSRLDEVQAAILNFQLQRLEVAIRKRQALAERYSNSMDGVGDISVPVIRLDRSHQFYSYAIRTGRRDGLMKHLAALGIETRINYDPPVHLMSGYKFLDYKAGDFPISEKLAQETLSLPMYPDLPMDSVDKVVEAVRTFFK